MKYLGGKASIAKELAQFIAAKSYNHTLFIEPFMGGCNMTEELAKHFRFGIASDVVPDLALLFRSLQEGWIPPEIVTEADYAVLKHASPSALRGLIGFGCSFGGKLWGGFAKARGDDYYGAAKRAVLRCSASTRNVCFRTADYRELAPISGATVYCDPPYANTAGYSCGNFDHDEFWNIMRKWACKGAQVFVSEYSAPSDFSAVWSKPRRQCLRTQGRQVMRVEKLYTL